MMTQNSTKAVGLIMNMIQSRRSQAVLPVEYVFAYRASAFLTSNTFEKLLLSDSEFALIMMTPSRFGMFSNPLFVPHLGAYSTVPPLILTFRERVTSFAGWLVPTETCISSRLGHPTNLFS